MSKGLTPFLLGHGLTEQLGRRSQDLPQYDLVQDTRVMAVLLNDGEHLHEEERFAAMAVAERLGLDPHQKLGTMLPTVATRLLPRIRQRGLTATYELERRCVVPTAAMMRAGLPIDTVGWKHLVERRTQANTEATQRIQKEVGCTEERRIARYVSKLGASDTSRAALMPLRGNVVVDSLLLMRSNQAFLSDLGPKVLEASSLDPAGRVHGHLDPLGTATGRYTCRGPNLLGLEKAVEVRDLVVAREGHRLIAADYSAADLRVLAKLASEHELVTLFANSGDPHRMTASVLFGVPESEVTASQRTAAKAVNFAVVFGAEASGVSEYARSNYGISMTRYDAMKFISRFKDHYIQIGNWQLLLLDSDSSESRSLGGRLRSGPMTNGARLNSPVQMSTSDALKMAIVALYPMLSSLGAEILLPVHDELLVEVPLELVDDIADLIEEEMENAMSSLLDNKVAVKVDVGVGRSWGDTGRTAIGATNV